MLTWDKRSCVSGQEIDILARRHLWADQKVYNHGTGHGVGYCLNVHEPPQGIGKYYQNPLVPGVVITDEPGYYEEGKFGIRIEDQLLVVERENKYIGFQNLTLVPYERKLIDLSQLTKFQVEYINQYHKKVWDTISPLLINAKDELALNWLKRNTTEIKI
eukprot:TRINITY_DN4324_c0_g4_i2.p4 TRINITY_DN4324_c0_g4~~TRINITY_DN4324_c0_g4_i2.p4  ORF type:complete len:160 (-),score=30.69 TRINITY_DN4324_c0_g4_i2:105-584(-)